MKLNDFLAQAFVIRDNEDISIPRALLTRIHSVALTEIEHFTKEIIEQPEKCKHNESPPYGSCSNVLEEMNYGTVEFLKSNLMNFKVAALLQFRGPLILPESSTGAKRHLKIQSQGDNLSLKKLLESLIKH